MESVPASRASRNPSQKHRYTPRSIDSVLHTSLESVLYTSVWSICVYMTTSGSVGRDSWDPDKFEKDGGVGPGLAGFRKAEPQPPVRASRSLDSVLHTSAWSICVYMGSLPDLWGGTRRIRTSSRKDGFKKPEPAAPVCEEGRPSW
jgi:hypothetical protein